MRNQIGALPSHRLRTCPQRPWSMALFKAIAISALIVLTSACSATYPINPPLSKVDPDNAYVMQNVANTGGRNNEALLLMAFSGGGTRAAAFSYGVLKEMSETTLGSGSGKHRLSDEIDAISAVSGGSFTAAYFGLYGERIFDDYEDVFLRRDVQGELSGQLFNPFNWPRVASPFFTRADMATELYDDTIFNGATFGDLNDADGPFIVINATEMTLGTRFQFTQEYADIVCMDLAKLPVARAVTASSAVPLLFSPITITNRAGDCQWQKPEWITRALSEESRTSRLYNLASSMEALENRDDHPFLHLFDGGLADNLGLRAILDGALRHDGFLEALEALGMQETRRVLVILVNAETALDVESSRKMQTPTFTAALGAATSVPLQRYSFETVALLKSRLKKWEQQSFEDECGGQTGIDVEADCKGVDFHFIEVNFSEHPDADERHYLKQLPTSFALDDEAVDRLIEAGRVVLRGNPQYQRLLNSQK